MHASASRLIMREALDCNPKGYNQGLRPCMLVQSTRLFPEGCASSMRSLAAHRKPCTHSPVHLLCYPLALCICIEKNSVFINAFLANISCHKTLCFVFLFGVTFPLHACAKHKIITRRVIMRIFLVCFWRETDVRTVIKNSVTMRSQAAHTASAAFVFVSSKALANASHVAME